VLLRLLIACGREIRRFNAQISKLSKRKVKHYLEKAEELYNELMTAHGVPTPLDEESNRRAWSMTLNSMIYVECNAQRPDSALKVYIRMKGLGIVPDKWAASGGCQSKHWEKRFAHS